MKITKTQLKQIIKEELTAQEEQMAGGISSMAQEIYEPEEYASINFRAIINGAIRDLGLEELDEIFGRKEKKEEDEEKPELKKAKKLQKRMGKKQSEFDKRMKALGLEEDKE